MTAIASSMNPSKRWLKSQSLIMRPADCYNLPPRLFKKCEVHRHYCNPLGSDSGEGKFVQMRALQLVTLAGVLGEAYLVRWVSSSMIRTEIFPSHLIGLILANYSANAARG